MSVCPLGIVLNGALEKRVKEQENVRYKKYSREEGVKSEKWYIK
jgi:hypothetical protein